MASVGHRLPDEGRVEQRGLIARVPFPERQPAPRYPCRSWVPLAYRNSMILGHLLSNTDGLLTFVTPPSTFFVAQKCRCAGVPERGRSRHGTGDVTAGGDPAEEADRRALRGAGEAAQGGDERAIERLWELNEADLHRPPLALPAGPARRRRGRPGGLHQDAQRAAGLRGRRDPLPLLAAADRAQPRDRHAAARRPHPRRGGGPHRQPARGGRRATTDRGRGLARGRAHRDRRLIPVARAAADAAAALRIRPQVRRGRRGPGLQPGGGPQAAVAGAASPGRGPGDRRSRSPPSRR